MMMHITKRRKRLDDDERSIAQDVPKPVLVVGWRTHELLQITLV